MKKLITVCILAGVVTHAAAWGQREQGIVTGAVVAGMIFSNKNSIRDHGSTVIIESRGTTIHYHTQPRIIYHNAPVIIQQAPVILPPVHVPQNTGTCLQHPLYDQFRQFRGYQISCH